MQVNLEAEEGPLGTHDLRISVAAMPAEDGKTFIRLSLLPPKAIRVNFVQWGAENILK